MAYAGKNAFVTISSTAVTLTAVATTSADGLVYQIASSSAQGEPFDPTAAITVAATSATLSSTAYTLNRLNGSVIFATTAARTITVSGSYLPTSAVSGAHGYAYTIAASNQDVTTFQASYISRIQGLKDVSGSLEDFHSTPAMAQILTSSSQPIAITFHASSTASFDARAWGYLSGDDISASVDGVVDGSVSFEGTADADSRVVTFTTRGSG